MINSPRLCTRIDFQECQCTEWRNATDLRGLILNCCARSLGRKQDALYCDAVELEGRGPVWMTEYEKFEFSCFAVATLNFRRALPYRGGYRIATGPCDTA